MSDRQIEIVLWIFYVVLLMLLILALQ